VNWNNLGLHIVWRYGNKANGTHGTKTDAWEGGCMSASLGVFFNVGSCWFF